MDEARFPETKLPHTDNNGVICLVPTTGHWWSGLPGGAQTALEDCLLPIFGARYCLLL